MACKSLVQFQFLTDLVKYLLKQTMTLDSFVWLLTDWFINESDYEQNAMPLVT